MLVCFRHFPIQRSIDEESLDGVTYEAKPRKVPSREHSFRAGKSAIGFIMFECGLENIDVKAVRRLGFSENVDEKFTQKMEKVAKRLHNIQTSTRIELERELGNRPKTVFSTGNFSWFSFISNSV
jgi:hypothetical protein